MKRTKQMTAAVLAGILTGTGWMTGYAGTLPPVCDETLYITLDGDGAIAESSVVKRYEVREDGEITDYGTYEKVANLSTKAEPAVREDGGYSFPVKKEDGAFYFEGTTQTRKEELPWDIEVSYLLNGVETPADQLAGKSGLVEIQADLVPNRNVSDFYRNNVALTMTTMVDRDEVLSLRAEGAQVQTVGNISAVVFFALPGEECHYTIAIGSDDFEFSGLFFLMVPLTLSQLEQVEDLRDAKDTLEDSKNAVSDSMDVLFDTLDQMQSGIADTANGLRGLDQAREIIHSGKDSVYAEADQALEDLDALANSLRPFREHTDQAQNALNAIRGDINEMVSDVNKLEPKLEDLKETMRNLEYDADDLRQMLRSPQMEGASQALAQILAKTEQDLKQAMISQGELDQSVKDFTAAMMRLQAAGASLEEQTALLNDLDLDTDYDPEEIEDLLLALEDDVELIDDRATKSCWTIPDEVKPALGEMMGAASGMTGNRGLLQDAAALVQLTEQVLAAVKSQEGKMEETLSETSDLFHNLARISDAAEDICTDIDDLNQTLERHHPEAIQTLEDLGVMTDRAAAGVGSLSSFFRTLEHQMQSAGGNLNEGTRATLNGLADVLDHAGEGLDQTDVLKNAKDTILRTMDDKWDEFSEDHTTILNIDLDAKPVSLTSRKNPSPRSMQIIVRTKEITKDDEAASAEVDENYYPEGNVFHRIGLIFKKIWDAICSIFR